MRFALAVLAGLALVPGAAAEDGLVFAASPGQTLHGSVRLPGAEQSSAVDATTRNATGISYRARTPAGVGRWISIGTRDEGMVPLTIRVPRDAAPGQYFAGVAAEGRVVGIEVDVSGPLVTRFVLGEVNVGGTRGRPRLYLHVANTGNVARRPEGLVSIQTRGGTTLQEARFRMGSFLPRTTIDYPLPLRGRLRPGTYVAVVRLTYPDAGGVGTQTSSAAPSFTVSKQPRTFDPQPSSARPAAAAGSQDGSSAWPWVAAAAGGVLLVGAAVVLGHALLRRRPVTVSVTPVQASPPPQATRCAGHHYWHVDWDSARPDDEGLPTYVHRCRRCGLEVRATDIGEARAKADALG